MRGVARLAMVGVFAAFAASTIGCGYTVSARGDGSHRESERIVIHTIENMVAPPRPGLEYDLTRRLRSEVASDQRFVAVAGAPTKVRVVLTEFLEPTLVRDLTNVQTEIALVATAEVRIEEPGQVRVATVTGRASYAPGAGEGKEAGLTRLWRNLSRNILDAVGDRDWVTDVAE